MDDETSPSGTPGARKRPATVIDLEATEVQPRAAESKEGAPSESPASRLRTMLWGRIGAGLAGAGGGLVVFLLLWLGGVLSGGRDVPADPSPRLAAIESKLSELATRPIPPAADPKVLDDLAARLGKIEAALATPRPPVTDPVVLGRLTATEGAVKSTADNMAGLSRRADSIDASLRETNSRIEKLTAALAEAQVTARQAAAGSDRASRFAIAASTLRNAVEHGDPFTAELAVVKPLTSDTAAIAALEPFAATGVPGNVALGHELAAVVRVVPRPDVQAVASGGSFIDRLSANAEKLVRIRPVGEARGDDRDAILARVEQRAAQGDINGAMAELMKLSADARAPAQAWIARAEARGKALDAGRKLAADAVAALKAAP